MTLSVSQKLVDGVELSEVQQAVVSVLDSFYDPEIPVSIWQLGLIYDFEVKDRKASVIMTLTTPACPVAGEMPGQIKQRLEEIDGIDEAQVDLTWEPPWEPAKMSEAAKLELNMFD